VVGAIQRRSRSKAERSELSGCGLAPVRRATTEPQGETTKLASEASVKEIPAPYPAREGHGVRSGPASGTGLGASPQRRRDEALIVARRQDTQG
jgi:hypothetical protein